MAAAATVGGVGVNEELILLEAGSDPSLLKIQGENAPLELLAEVKIQTKLIFIYLKVFEMCDE